MKIRLFFISLFVVCTLSGYADNAGAENTEGKVSAAIQQCSSPFLLSLFLSHGSGLYAMKQPGKANLYLLTNILFADLPVITLAGAIVVNRIQPEFYQGMTLTVTEYVVNACLISAVIAIPLLRFFECRDVLKACKKDNAR